MPTASPTPIRAGLPFWTGLAAFVLAAPFAWSTREFFDEGIYASNALRVLSGQVIYRDFFEFVAPLSSWFAAPLLALFGHSLWILRLGTAAALGVGAWQLVHVARLLGVRGPLAALPGLLLAGALYATIPGYSHHWLVQPLLWGAVLAAMRGLEAPGARPWLVAGATTGLAALAMQSDGLVLALALGAWVGLDAWLGRTPVPRAAARLGACAVGALCVLIPVTAYFALEHALGAAVYDTLVWVRTHYRMAGGANDITYMTDLPALIATTGAGFSLSRWYVALAYSLAVMLLPAIALAGLWTGLAAALGERVRAGVAWTPEAARRAFLAILLAGLFALLLRGRADFAHDIYYLPASLLGATVLAAAWRETLAGPALRFVRWLPAAGLVAFGAAAFVLTVARCGSEPGYAPRRGGPDAAFAADPVVEYLRAHARPGDRLAALPVGGLYYFYALPPAVTHTTMLESHQRYFDDAEIAAYWREVTTARPRFVVVAPFVRPPAVPALPVAGYRLVAILDFATQGVARSAYVYER